MSKLRLQVFLSRNGVCSRRKAMDVVKEARVTVNGKVVKEPSTPVDPDSDVVCVDGKQVKVKRFEYILLNKQQGYVTTKAEYQFQKTIFDLLPKEYVHLSPVGRLDKNTEGLLLLTNDGDLAYKLTHPKHNVDKVYFVRIEGVLKKDEVARLEKGLVLEGKKTALAQLKEIKTTTHQTEFYITIHEGRKRQVRMMVAKVGHEVIYLKRVAQGPLTLGDLKIGQYRSLTEKEIKSLEAIEG